MRNPFNHQQVSRISLNSDVVDCIVFWTKNPANLVNKLSVLDRMNYHYYFQFTLTPYGRDVEPNLPDKQDMISTFINLSKMIGRDRMAWRYDPVVLTGRLDQKYHYREFEAMVQKLAPYTERCIISFLDFYEKTKRNMAGLNVVRSDMPEMREIAGNFMKIARSHGLRLETCAEEVDLTDIGIENGKCIDDKLISKILGRDMFFKKAQGQRKTCGCISSIDIGAYNSCPHNCLYCYANYSNDLVKANIALHDPNSPFLIGRPQDDDKVIQKKMESCIQVQ